MFVNKTEPKAPVGALGLFILIHEIGLLKQWFAGFQMCHVPWGAGFGMTERITPTLTLPRYRGREAREGVPVIGGGKIKGKEGAGFGMTGKGGGARRRNNRERAWFWDDGKMGAQVLILDKKRGLRKRHYFAVF